MPVIGITGGIATGKSTVAKMFAELGATVFSADEAAREVTAPGTPALQEIARTFGPKFILADGSLDRAALGYHVFHDPAARQKLEAITHPQIRELLRQQIDGAGRGRFDVDYCGSARIRRGLGLKIDSADIRAGERTFQPLDVAAARRHSIDVEAVPNLAAAEIAAVRLEEYALFVPRPIRIAVLDCGCVRRKIDGRRVDPGPRLLKRFSGDRRWEWRPWIVEWFPVGQLGPAAPPKAITLRIHVRCAYCEEKRDEQRDKAGV